MTSEDMALLTFLIFSIVTIFASYFLKYSWATGTLGSLAKVFCTADMGALNKSKHHGTHAVVSRQLQNLLY
jgi:hypothetical protein